MPFIVISGKEVNTMVLLEKENAIHSNTKPFLNIEKTYLI
jgi:hypothetical protein